METINVTTTKDNKVIGQVTATLTVRPDGNIELSYPDPSRGSPPTPEILSPESLANGVINRRDGTRDVFSRK